MYSELGDFTKGNFTFITTGENTERVVDSNGDEVIDSSSDEVWQDCIGFELVSSYLVNALVIDSNNNTVENSAGREVWQNVITSGYVLASRLFGDDYADYAIYISEVIDLGSIVDARLSIFLNMYGDRVNSHRSIYISISDDKETWSAWASFAPGEYSCRYYRVRIIFWSDDTADAFELRNLEAGATKWA